MKVYFYLKEKEEKTQTIYCRINAGMIVRNGKKVPDRKAFATPIKCTTSEWDSKDQRITGRTVSAQQRNNDLLSLRLKFEKDIPNIIGNNGSTAEALELYTQPTREKVEVSLSYLAKELKELAENGGIKSSKGLLIKKNTQNSIRFRMQVIQEYAEKHQDINLAVKNFSNLRTIEEKIALKEFYREYIENFNDYLSGKYLDNTKAVTVANFKRLLKYAQEKYFFDLSPARDMLHTSWDEFEVVEVPQRLFQYLVVNRKSIRKGLSEYQRKVFDFILYAGTVAKRLSDILNLTKDNFKRKENGLVVSLKTMKTGTPIQLILPEYLDEIIMENIMLYGKPFDLSVSYKFYQTIREILKEIPGFDFPIKLYRKKNGVDVIYKDDFFYNTVTPHTFRRTGATNMIQSGIEPHVVKAIGGWSANSKIFDKRYLAYNQDFANRSVVKYYEALQEDESNMKVAN